MNPQTLDRMPEYVKKLPKSIQELVFDDAWEVRTTEIARKYSLNETQTDTLCNNVLLVLIGLDNPDDFTKLLTSELGISKLLAGQIIEDLEMRVFEYALKTIENKEKKNVEQIPKENLVQIKEEQKTEIIIPTKPQVPEIKPVNLPMVERGEVAHDVPLPSKPIETPSYKPVFNTNNATNVISEAKSISHINYELKSTPVTEPIQRPVSVPRFTGVKIEDESTPKADVFGSTQLEVNNTQSRGINLIDKKLNTPEKTDAKPTPEVKVEPQKMPSHNYAVDPYREPME